MSSLRKSVRLGFSLLDVVILAAILLVSMLIVVPAVQRVRANALQKGTVNNLRQCAIAIHNYHGVFNKMPSASKTGGIYTKPGEERTMWFHLLSFVEVDAAYKDNVHNAVVDAYLSPDDKNITAKEGRISFAGNIRIFGYNTLTEKLANDAVEQPKGDPSGRSLSGKLKELMVSGLTLARIPDGTSNTLMLATRYAECGSPVQSTYYSGSPTGTILAGGGYVASVGAPKAGKGGFFGAGSHHKAPGDSADAIFQPTPTVAKCLPDESVFGHSLSAKGLAVALCDASVRVLDSKMTPTTFCRALCPSDGHALGNDWDTD